MKISKSRCLPLAAFLAFAGSALAFADTVPATSSITAVTVYADRAVVTRDADLDLPIGQSDVTFAGLPADLSDQSLQVSGHGTEATILDVNARVVYTEATPDPRVLAAETTLTDLRHQDALLKNKLDAVAGQRALLTRIETAATQPPPKDSAAPRIALDDWQKLLGFTADNTARLDTERQSIEDDRVALTRKIAAAESQLNELRGRVSGPHATKTVTVHVAAEHAGALRLTLAYALGGASWSPSYDARLDADKHTVALTYFGVVRNATGEDWNRVALTLSTARPNLGGDAAALAPWIVDVARPIAASADAYAPAPGATGGVMITAGTLQAQAFNSSSLEGGKDADGTYARAAQKASTLATATLDSAATSASFKIPVAATIPSDNTPQKVGVATAALDVRLQYQATPKLLETAYLDAYAANATEYPLLAGPVSTFLGNTFVATSRMKTVMPGEKFSLAFGADEGIDIRRKLVRRFTESAGFTGKQKRVTYEFLVTVTNHKRTAERVVFKDAAPISRDERIVVKLLAPAERDLLKPEDAAAQPPKLGVSRDTDGKLLWRLDLAPGEKREIPLKFTVEYPADLAVDGLE